MKILSANMGFGITRKLIVSTQAKTFVNLFMIYLEIEILPLIMFTFFLRDNARKINNHKLNQKSCFLSNIWIQDGTSLYLMLERLKKLKSGVRYYVAKYKNDQDSIITVKEWQLVNHFFLLLE